MKIKKEKSVVNSTIDTSALESNNISARDEAINFIESAIQALSICAKGDDLIAKESIANLAVIMFDLNESK